MTINNDQTLCPCGSKKTYSDCCQPLHEGLKSAETAEQLMRSRYTAFYYKNTSYIAQTCWPQITDNGELIELEAYLNSTQWHGLSVLNTSKGKSKHDKGTVTFRAEFTQTSRMGIVQVLEERSSFRKIEGRWYYTEGDVKTSHN